MGSNPIFGTLSRMPIVCYNKHMTIYWGRRSYTEEQFREAWENSVSIAEVARKLNLTVYGSTYKTLRHAAKELELSEDHFLGQGWNVGLKFNPSKAKPIEEVLVEGSSVQSSNLKARLFKEGLKEKVCEICGLTEWLGEPAPLALDHINGVNNDNRLENLRILCYNCHGQTETWCRGKGKKKNAALEEKRMQREKEKQDRREKNAERLKTQRVGFLKEQDNAGVA